MSALSNPTVARPFFVRLHHAATKQAGYRLMNQWQAQHQAQGKRGGINEVTKSLFNIMVSKVLPASMKDLATHQPKEYQRCIAENTFVLFTTTKSLITLLSKEYEYLKRCKRTIYNHINLLLKTGIFTEKINHISTGWRNPLPSEEHPKGRGKFKLVFAMGVVHIRPSKTNSKGVKTPSFFASNKQTLPQYALSKESTISINSTASKSIYNTPPIVGKSASPAGESTNLYIENIEQGSKSLPLSTRKKKSALFSPTERIEYLHKRALQDEQDKTAQYLYQLLKRELYPSQSFNELTRKTVLEGLRIHMDAAKQAVENYRQDQLQHFKQSTPFLIAKRRERKLANFTKSLPDVQLATIEIIGHAWRKQRNYAQKYGWTLWQPASFIHSKAARKAVELSIKDWLHIHLCYFESNLKSSAWAKHTQWINTTYAKRVQQAQRDGVATAQRTAMQLYRRWVQRLNDEPHLSPTHRTELMRCFLERLKSLAYE